MYVRDSVISTPISIHRGTVRSFSGTVYNVCSNTGIAAVCGVYMCRERNFQVQTRSKILSSQIMVAVKSSITPYV